MQLDPFLIRIPDGVLEDLRRRLARARWPDQAAGRAWEHGTDRTYLRSLADHWGSGFDWRAQEAGLNALPHYTVSLSGIDVHLIHQPGTGPDPMPLLLLHGWPLSCLEFHKVISPLADPAGSGGAPEAAFTVVAPSLPGFPCSYRPGDARQDARAMAELCSTLMTRVLGFDRYAVHAGDVGSTVAACLASAHPEQLHGLHLNSVAMSVGDRAGLSAEERSYLERFDRWRAEESGYAAVQSTTPQTLAYGLTDSPVGLAGWVVEKLRAWTDCGGDLDAVLSRDEVLTHLTLYWASAAVNASFWPYWSRSHGGWALDAAGPRIRVPTAVAAFPEEPFCPPETLLRRVLDVERWTPMPAGGHFPALEQPAALADALRAFFRSDVVDRGTRA